MKKLRIATTAALTMAAALGLVMTESASADVRTRQVNIEYGSPPPSLNPDPADDPANQILLRSYSVTYDSDAGTVTYAGQFNGDPAQSLSWLPNLKLSCGNRALTTNLQPHYEGDPVGSGSAFLQGFEGYVKANVQKSGTSVAFTFSHPELRGQGYECFRELDDFGGDPGGKYYFAGYSPRQKAEREPTYITVGPYRWSDRLFLDNRPARFGLWGLGLAGSGRFTNVTWTSWKRDAARGKGYGVALHSALNKHGHYTFDRYKVRFRLSRTKLCGDVYEFTRIQITSRFGSRSMKIPSAC